jgi:hypothetical protein
VANRIGLTLLLSFFVIAGAARLVCAQNLFQDPNIPNGETVTYSSRVGNEQTTIVERTLIKEDAEKKLYEITSRSDSIDKTILLEKDSMAVVSVHTKIKYEDVTLDSRITVIDENPSLQADDLQKADVSTLQYFFRGFPFGKTGKVKLQFYGVKNKIKSPIVAEFKKTETVGTNENTIECYKFEFGIESFWQKFFPKTTMWYSVVSPHYLVRYEGPSGPPGAPKRVIELVSYDVPAAAGE